MPLWQPCDALLYTIKTRVTVLPTAKVNSSQQTSKEVSQCGRSKERKTFIKNKLN